MPHLDFAKLHAILFGILAGLCFGCSAHGQPESWLTGKKLEDALPLSLSIAWQDAPLRERLNQLSERQRISIFLDRRVDPATKINLSLQNASFEQVLWRIAAETKLEAVRIDNLYYIGPANETIQLPLLIEQSRDAIGKLERKQARVWRKSTPIKWPRLHQPRVTLVAAMKSNGFAVTNEQALAHDVWPEYAGPAVRLDVQMALLTFGFGKWFKVTPGSTKIELIDAPVIKNGKRRFANVKNAQQLARRLKAQFPQNKISATKSSISVAGTPREVAEVRRSIVLNTATIGDNSASSGFDINTTASRKAILRAVAKQSGLELILEGDTPGLDTPMKLNLKQKTAQEIIVAVLEGTDYQFQLQDSKLTVTKK